MPTWAAGSKPHLPARTVPHTGRARGFTLIELLVVIAIVAIAGEATADRQLSRFARNPANSGKVCDKGLWAWSRHPNYFFEALYWVALVPIGIGHGWGLVALAAPVMMFVLLRYVSGVPPLEQHMLRTRGAAFASYQQRVPPFLPRPPRR